LPSTSDENATVEKEYGGLPIAWKCHSARFGKSTGIGIVDFSTLCAVHTVCDVATGDQNATILQQSDGMPNSASRHMAYRNKDLRLQVRYSQTSLLCVLRVSVVNHGLITTETRRTRRGN